MTFWVKVLFQFGYSSEILSFVKLFLSWIIFIIQIFVLCSLHLGICYIRSEFFKHIYNCYCLTHKLFCFSQGTQWWGFWFLEEICCLGCSCCLWGIGFRHLELDYWWSLMLWIYIWPHLYWGEYLTLWFLLLQLVVL